MRNKYSNYVPGLLFALFFVPAAFAQTIPTQTIPASSGIVLDGSGLLIGAGEQLLEQDPSGWALISGKPALNLGWTPSPSQTSGFPNAHLSSAGTQLAPEDDKLPSVAQASDEQPLTTAPSGTMPSSLTSPVLPNVPSSLKQDGLEQPLNPQEQVTPDTVVPESTSAETSASQTQAAKTETASLKKGPRLRESYSPLFTQQRPFLLFAQDLSITYLMPNALVDHPYLSGYLRSILEERALAQWKTSREELAAKGQEARMAGEERPPLVINGRVEDRFYSASYSSLYLEEIKSLDGAKLPSQILSFNYDNQAKSPISLSDLFKGKDEKALAATVELIDAYIQTDIVRQKSIRLGTLVRPDQDAWLKDLKPSLELLKNFTFVPSRQTGMIAGLMFHFNPGLLGAEADGMYEVYIPASIFSAMLADKFVEVFGGDALQINRHSGKGFAASSVNIEGLKSGADLGGEMLIEGEVPENWCNGFHLLLVDSESKQIVTEGVVKMLPDLPSYGLASNMMRFRAELRVSGDGVKSGQLTFEPYPITVEDGRVMVKADSACNLEKPIAMPDPDRDAISINVNY
ncbi:hypothetical protein [uncultured Cohaesibacter sp.]|uniref:hypothetical protein n=1 Tax=uncultured Cohaesibacter sp. TaxID=1002546 RepID=UPI002930FE98|nr:hypothetical protein [uncultured Cohaesibacter sp.]